MNDTMTGAHFEIISIARQCKWRPQGQCLKDCLGLAVCNLDGLTLVDAHGRPLAPAEPMEN